jgi:hypothetical protein
MHQTERTKPGGARRLSSSAGCRRSACGSCVGGCLGYRHGLRYAGYLVAVLSPGTDVYTIEQKKAALAYPNSEIRYTGEVAVSPDETVADTLVGSTGEHDVTVLGATEGPGLVQFLSGTVPAVFTNRGQDALLLVNGIPSFCTLE